MLNLCLFFVLGCRSFELKIFKNVRTQIYLISTVIIKVHTYWLISISLKKVYIYDPKTVYKDLKIRKGKSEVEKKTEIEWLKH